MIQLFPLNFVCSHIIQHLLTNSVKYKETDYGNTQSSSSSTPSSRTFMISWHTGQTSCIKLQHLHSPLLYACSSDSSMMVLLSSLSYIKYGFKSGMENCSFAFASILHSTNNILDSAVSVEGIPYREKNLESEVVK